MKPIIMKTFLLTLLMLTSWTFLRAQEVRIETIYPEFCKSGDHCTVAITINKGDIQGFARVQQMLPEGFSATLIEDGGSDFIFDKQKVSFIWLSIPASPAVTVSYALVPSPNLAGAYTIEDGTFSYLLDNKITRETVAGATLDINKRTSKVPKEPVVAVAKDKPDTPEIKENPEIKDPPPAEKSPPMYIDTTQSPKIAPRTTDKEPPPTEKSPSMYIDTTQSPKIAARAAEEAPKPKNVEIERTPKPTEAKQIEKPKPSEVIEKPAPVVTKTKEVIQEKTPEPVTPPSAEITFRVQFAALKSYREISLIQQQYNISEKVYHETDGTWHRYTFGSWNSAEEASAASKSFHAKTGISSYVVKYRNGKRL